jgi:6-phosphogluconolactonase
MNDSEASVVVHATPDLLAEDVAARFIIKLVDAQAERGVASAVLTGGRVAAKVYRAVAASPARDAVDWSRVDLWWGDERFLPSGDPERNETQARAALLDAVPVDPDRIHPMPATDWQDVEDPESAAAQYAGTLAYSAKPGSEILPHFDVLLLGVGEDGHIASVFPEHPAVYEKRPVVAVRGAPKPPPNRLTLTPPAINTAEEVWLIATGSAKADAVGLALSGAGPVQVPAAGVRGVSRTLWLLDREAAAHVSPRLRSLR